MQQGTWVLWKYVAFEWCKRQKNITCRNSIIVRDVWAIGGDDGFCDVILAINNANDEMVIGTTNSVYGSLAKTK